MAEHVMDMAVEDRIAADGETRLQKVGSLRCVFLASPLSSRLRIFGGGPGLGVVDAGVDSDRPVTRPLDTRIAASVSITLRRYVQACLRFLMKCGRQSAT